MMTEERKGYQGWANYATWCVKLWIDNDEYLQREYEDRAQAHVNLGNGTWELADEMKDEFEEFMPELQGMWADLLQSAFGDVDWREIAHAFMDDCTPEEDEQEEE